MIFLSYSWSNDQIANSVDLFFENNNITITRDRRDLKYKQSIKEFMKLVREAEFVIMIISKEYLQSKNCMYEVLEFVKDTNFRDRIIPVISSNSDIFSIENRIEIQKYWTNEIEKLEKLSKNLDPTKSLPIVKELREYKYIENEILDFLEVICDMNNIVLNKDVFNDIHFDTISNFIQIDNLKLKEIVLNLKIKEDSNINSSEIIEYLSNNFTDFNVYSLKKDSMTFKLKSYKNEKDIKDEIIKNFKISDFSHFYCFNYSSAYYIASNKKIKEYNSKSIVWWSHFENGYTENVKDAGLYSIEQLKNIIDIYSDAPYEKDQFAIDAELVDKLDLRVIPINSDYSRYLINKPDKNYGISSWDYTGMH